MPPRGTVLVVDDSIATGRSMAAALKAARGVMAGQHRVVTGALYVDDMSQADYCLRVVRRPRPFAWNWIGHVQLKRCLLDIDGVVCGEPPVRDDDGVAYQVAIRNARPLHIPTIRVGGLATGRLERWRGITEAWLGENGVDFGRLMMYHANTAKDRPGAGGVAKWKGDLLRHKEFSWMIESSAKQAPIIAKTAGKPVVCLEDEVLYR